MRSQDGTKKNRKPGPRPEDRPDDPFDGPDGAQGARTAVVVPVLGARYRAEAGDAAARSNAARLEEAIGLAAAIDAARAPGTVRWSSDNRPPAI